MKYGSNLIFIDSAFENVINKISQTNANANYYTLRLEYTGEYSLLDYYNNFLSSIVYTANFQSEARQQDTQFFRNVYDNSAFIYQQVYETSDEIKAEFVKLSTGSFARRKQKLDRINDSVYDATSGNGMQTNLDNENFTLLDELNNEVFKVDRGGFIYTNQSVFPTGLASNVYDLPVYDMSGVLLGYIKLYK